MQELHSQDMLINAVNAGDIISIKQALDDLHPSEIADILESLPQKDRNVIWENIPYENKGDVLSHAQDPVRIGLLEQMPPEEVAKVTKSLDADDIADILNDLPENVIDDVMLTMDAQDRFRLASVLSYSDDTAGGLMNPDIVSVRADVTLDVVSRYSP
jgi:magnesium transporter